MADEPIVAYHGSSYREEIMKSGLKKGSYMALDPIEAARYGPVVEIDLTQVDGTWPRVTDEIDGVVGDLHWQAHLFQTVHPSALSYWSLI